MSSPLSYSQLTMETVCCSHPYPLLASQANIMGTDVDVIFLVNVIYTNVCVCNSGCLYKVPFT